MLFIYSNAIYLWWKRKCRCIWVYKTIQSLSLQGKYHRLLFHLAVDTPLVVDHMRSTDFTPNACCSWKSFFICIKFNISQLCCVTGHSHFCLQRLLSLGVASFPLKMNGINGILSLHVSGSVKGASVCPSWSFEDDKRLCKIVLLS